MFKDKTFSYFNKNELTTSRTSQGKGRIRVAAGDKCVAPAKSRPKKRKTLASTDQSGLSMDAVEWSDEVYTVRQLVQTFGSTFPILVKVTQGYYGEINIEYSVDQVLQLHSFSEQERIQARDNRGRVLSLPLDYAVEVQVYDRTTTETKRLEDAVRKYPLPVRLHIIRALDDVNRDVVNLIGEKISVEKSHEELYLRGNSIIDGWINQSDIALLPEFMGMEFMVAVGMRGATQDEWEDYQNMFARSVRSMHFQRIAGYDGVVVLEPGTPGTEDTLPPQTQLPPTGQIYENIPSKNKPKKSGPDLVPSLEKEKGLLTTPSMDKNKPKYENIKIQPQQNDKPKRPQYEKVILSASESKGSRSPPTAPKPSREKLRRKKDADVVVHRSAEADEHLEVTEMFDNVLKVAEETLEKEEKDKNANKGGKGNNKKGPGGFVNTGYSQTPPESRHNSNAPRAVVQPVQQGKGPYVISFSLNNNNPPDSITKNNKTIDKKNKKRESRLSSAGGEFFKSLEDVPDDIDSLTVDQVVECLKLLHMDLHCADFRKHQIDGGLLSGLKESVLQSDFGFTPFNASKLSRFARGWRPKMS